MPAAEQQRAASEEETDREMEVSESRGEGSGDRWNKRQRKEEDKGGDRDVPWCTAPVDWRQKEMGVEREEGGSRGTERDQQRLSTSVCEWRLPLEGAVKGQREGDWRDPGPSFSSLITGPWDPAKEMIDEWYKDKHEQDPRRMSGKIMHAAS